MNIETSILELIANLVLLGLALDHLVTGFVLVFLPTASSKMARLLFGAELPMTPGITLILKPWGALGMFAGVVGLMPIFQPENSALVLYALLWLLLTRIYYRVRFMRATETSLRISKRRNWFHIGLIALCAAMVVVKLGLL